MYPTVSSELETLLNEPAALAMERERRALEETLDSSGNRFVLFGAGSLGRRALACLRSIGLNPLALSDNNQRLWGTELEGVRILSPADAAERFGSDAVFFVTIWTADHRFTETRCQLQKLGAHRVVPGAAIYWRFPSTFLPYYAVDQPHKVYLDRDRVADAANLWADERSAREYEAQIRWRAFGDPDGLPAPERETYFPPDLITLSPDEDFVDCGAYDGDTMRSFLAESRGRFRSITALEADPDSFCILDSCVAAIDPALRQKIKALQCAVGRERGGLRFVAGQGVNSRAAAEGELIVPCVTLDDLLGQDRATFIKMDIEGSEFDALLGARRIIERDQPVLAICVYHRQEDLWRIPLLIREMSPSYRFYLRMYECDGWQTVMYAVPPERAA